MPPVEDARPGALRVAPLAPGDRAAWEPLARGYKDFYATPTTADEYDAAWRRLMAGTQVHGLAAWHGERLVGIAHYLFHASTWASSACYLQDLFTAPDARGLGAGRALIEAVGREAQARGASRCYWLTQAHNATARRLYDRLARHNGFIRYDYPLPPRENPPHPR